MSNLPFVVALSYEATQQIMKLTRIKRNAIHDGLWGIRDDPYGRMHLEKNRYTANLAGYRVDYYVQPDASPPTVAVFRIRKLRYLG